MDKKFWKNTLLIKDDPANNNVHKIYKTNIII